MIKPSKRELRFDKGIIDSLFEERKLSAEYIVQLFEDIQDCQTKEQWEHTNKKRFIELIEEYKQQPQDDFDYANSSMEEIKEHVVESMMESVRKDLGFCPDCDGSGFSGHDRCDPPNPYVCENCDGKGMNS